jgi:hypothetical protein
MSREGRWDSRQKDQDETQMEQICVIEIQSAVNNKDDGIDPNFNSGTIFLY